MIAAAFIFSEPALGRSLAFRGGTAIHKPLSLEHGLVDPDAVIRCCLEYLKAGKTPITRTTLTAGRTPRSGDGRG